LQEFKKILDSFLTTSVDYSDMNKSFKQMHNCIFEIFKIHITETRKVNLEIGSSLFRVRRNQGNLRFKNPNDLFPPPQHLTNFGRVNLKHCPVYYCSDNSTTSILESKLEEGDYFTLIENSLVKKIQLAVIGNCSRYKLPNVLTKKLSVFDERITEVIGKKIENADDYLLTATLGNTLMSDHNFQGLMYPSVFATEQSDNFALRTNILNELLMFKNVRMFHVSKKLNENSLIINCIAKSNDISVKGEFSWTKVENCNSHSIYLDKNKLILDD
jgi:hypothetical protein